MGIEIFTKEVINHYCNNKDLITEELLSSLRAYGNEGKKIALEILDLEKDDEAYYLDAFGNRMSANGNRMLKKPFTKLPLSPIHIEEIKKCHEDIHYYKDNYVKIVTKSGINFPELRDYQSEFLDVIEDNESVAGLLPRQCCTKDTVLNISYNNRRYSTTFEDLFYECKRESKREFHV